VERQQNPRPPLQSHARWLRWCRQTCERPIWQSLLPTNLRFFMRMSKNFLSLREFGLRFKAEVKICSNPLMICWFGGPCLKSLKAAASHSHRALAR
jgi:hypothetical protein